MTTQDAINSANVKMKKTIDALAKDMSAIRTGRANPSLVQELLVDYYGTPTPLNQLATISAPEARLITIQPWDKSAIPNIEKSIQKSNLGINPSNDGTLIRLPIPPLTEERRMEMVKAVRRRTEEARISLRNIRRELLEELRALEKEKKASQDEVKRGENQLQQVTDRFIAQVDEADKKKEAELMAV